MNEVLNLYKKRGETPLECILRYKENNPEFENVPMTYAGRLDPLAEGVLLVLAGEAVHRKEEFLNLKKEYEVEVLFGVSTDTYDLLGLVKSEIRSTKSETNRQKTTSEATMFSVVLGTPGIQVQNSELGSPPSTAKMTEGRRNDKTEAEKTLKNFIGKNIFEYPQYSSKPVNGKPLFSLARSGELDGVEMPKKEVEIFNLEILNWREINSKDLLKDIIKNVNEVKGDFRQGEIISKWKEVLEGADENFQIVKIKAEVSSGTYMRTLAHEWGKVLGVPALAYHIVRTRVGGHGTHPPNF